MSNQAVRRSAATASLNAAPSKEFQPSRRLLLGGSLATASFVAGLGLAPGNGGHGGLIASASAQSASPPTAAPKGPQPLDYPGKDKGLVLLGDRPLVAETPESLLDDDTTPVAKFFVRNNGQTPEENKQGDAWSLKVEGEVDKPLALSVADLKSRFTPQTMRMVMECGDGRSFFLPQARGNQWTNGGAGCAEWTGARLADVLKAAGLKESAKFTGHYGADPHLSGDTTKDAISTICRRLILRHRPPGAAAG